MAKATISKSNQKKTYTNAADIITITGSSNKVYTKGGKDKITLSKGKNNLVDAGTGNDIIIIGKKSGSSNTIKAGAGSDKITVSAGTQTIDGGAGNDTITVSGGNKHTLRGGLGSDNYIINSAIAKSTLFTINQTDYKTKDADTLKLAKVSKADVTYGLLNGKMTIKHRSGGKIAVSGWSKNKLSKIVFKDGTLAASQYKNNIYNVKALNNAAGKTLTYKDGLKAHEEFTVNFSTNTNIVIDSTSATADRISFSNKGGWSNDHENIYRNGTDLIIGNWDSANAKDLDGKIIIKNFMQSSVKQIEFSNQTYYLLTKSGTYTGSDNYSDRFMIMDWSKTGTDSNVGDWNITIDGMRNNDLIDLRFLPVNSQFYSMSGTFDGRDMVLNYWYSPTTTTDTKLGTLRLQNYFKADGTVNTTPLIRINREFYAGDAGQIWFDVFSWNRIKGSNGEPEKNYRRAYLNAGTAGADNKDLGTLTKPNNKYVWLYYAGNGNDNITARAGDMVYGGNGNDTLRAAGRMSELRGDAGEDKLNIFGGSADAPVNLDHVNAYGGHDNDVIKAYGSYHYLAGSRGNDEIHIYNGSGEEAHTSAISGGSDNDYIYIHGGYDHRAYGSSGDDHLYAYAGHEHQLYGGSGDDTIELKKDVTNSEADGGAGVDTLISDGGDENILSGGSDNDTLIVNGGESSSLFGNNGDDTLTVNGGNNIQLHGGVGSDTYIVNSGFTAADGLHIYQNLDYGFNNGDADVLELTGINMGNVEYEFQENTLWICGLEGGNRVGSIAVNGWDENPLSSIKFANGTMTTDEINALKP